MVDLTQYNELIVQQQVEHLEAFTGIETENRYSVLTPDGEPIAHAYEESGFLARMFLRNHRPLTLHVVDDQNEPLLTASRGFFWFFSHLHVSDGAEQPVGSLFRRFGILKRRFSMEDLNGTEVAEMTGPLFRPNTFMIYQRGEEVARVTKQWSGILREGLTDADTFRVEFSSPTRDQRFCTLVLAAAFSIDLDFFESGGAGPGVGFGV